MVEKIREEVINVILAQSLTNKGLNLAIPETIRNKKRPDIIIVGLHGLTLLIEGRKEHLNKSLFRDTIEKLEQGYGDIGMAILYPPEIFEVKGLEDLRKKVEKTIFSGAVFYWTSEGLRQINFDNKDVKNIAELMRETFNIYVKNDILKNQVKEVQNSIEEIVKHTSKPDLWFSDKELLNRLISILGE